MHNGFSDFSAGNHRFYFHHSFIPNYCNFNVLCKIQNNHTSLEFLHKKAQCHIEELSHLSFNYVLGCVALIRGAAAYSDQTFPWMICRSVQCIAEKWRIRSGCHLAP